MSALGSTPPPVPERNESFGARGSVEEAKKTFSTRLQRDVTVVTGRPGDTANEKTRYVLLEKTASFEKMEEPQRPTSLRLKERGVVALLPKVSGLIKAADGKIQEARQELKKQVNKIINSESVLSALGAVKEKTEGAFGVVKEKTEGAFGAVKEKAEGAFGAIKEKTEGAFGSVKEKGEGAFGAIKERVPEAPWTQLKNFGSDLINAIKSKPASSANEKLEFSKNDEIKKAAETAGILVQQTSKEEIKMLLLDKPIGASFVFKDENGDYYLAIKVDADKAEFTNLSKTESLETVLQKLILGHLLPKAYESQEPVWVGEEGIAEEGEKRVATPSVWVEVGIGELSTANPQINDLLAATRSIPSYSDDETLKFVIRNFAEKAGVFIDKEVLEEWYQSLENENNRVAIPEAELTKEMISRLMLSSSEQYEYPIGSILVFEDHGVYWVGIKDSDHVKFLRLSKETTTEDTGPLFTT